MIQRVNAPKHINSIEWSQATGYARQVCAQVFRDGGAPGDALASHGLASNTNAGDGASDWGKAVELIAQTMCTSKSMSTRGALSAGAPLKKAA